MEVHMNKNKHLSKSERNEIESLLNDKNSFRAIARELDRDPTTIAKEVKNHISYKKTGCYGKAFNDCLYRMSCTASQVCGKKGCKSKLCKFCKSISCTEICPDYQVEICIKLSKPPYVCNGCRKRRSCTLEKRLYDASYAQDEYKFILSESRQGIMISEEEARRIDAIISPLLMKGQSLHHICVNNKDEIMMDERTLYNYVDYGIFAAKNLDMPRVVRMGKRVKYKTHKVDKKCRIGRTYKDFLDFMKVNHEYPIVEMDTVEGKKGGKVLLTIHFIIPHFMIAFIRDANTSQSVINIFNQLYLELRPDIFIDLFKVILTDNGSEFSNPEAIELDLQGNHRTSIFYCDPSAPHQKGAVENNHEFIRRIIPKGQPLDGYTQDDITLMMNHINSYSRKNLGDKSPHDIFTFLYGKDLLKVVRAESIPYNEIVLNPSLFKK